MQKTQHHIFYQASQDMSIIDNESVDLVVTSPPYPMIAMWDEIMYRQNKSIKSAFDSKNYPTVFELMHKELDKVWSECFRVLKKGGIACINIGDATRTLDGNFQLFSNHSRIIQSFLNLGFHNLPNIIWRKQTNSPNKFMGSGTLPPGAYVTLEHEYILIFRKGEKRQFKTHLDKENRQHSSFFWEERNLWFSDLWNFKGISQDLFSNNNIRKRSAAYPFELPNRLINMFSVYGDTILDPFLGTGTTSLAALANKRNSIGFEIDKNFLSLIGNTLFNKEQLINNFISDRLQKHLNFINERIKEKGSKSIKHNNTYYNFPVITRQEKNIIFHFIDKIVKSDNGFEANYLDEIGFVSSNSNNLFANVI